MTGLHIPVPLFVLRRLVRRNPWLLADGGTINRPLTVDLGFVEFEVNAAITLTPKNRAQLMAEHGA